MSKKIVLKSITILFILLFLYTGMNKLIGSQTFIRQVKEIPFLYPIASWLRWAVSILEFWVVILLIRARWRLIGLYTSFGLMLAFTAYMILFIWYSDGIVCGCGGVLEQIPPSLHLLLNIVLAILAIPAIKLQKQLNQHIAQELPAGHNNSHVGKAV